eukprot:5706931-Pyramimonas_sp.AAC.1
MGTSSNNGAAKGATKGQRCGRRESAKVYRGARVGGCKEGTRALRVTEGATGRRQRWLHGP